MSAMPGCSCRRPCEGDRDTARSLLGEGKVSLLVGYERGSAATGVGHRSPPGRQDVDPPGVGFDLLEPLRGRTARPLPAASAEERPGNAAAADRFRGEGVRPAIDRGPCEGTAGAAEGGLVLIGVPCTGMVDERMVREAVGSAEIASFADDGATVVGTHGGRDRAPLEREAALQYAPRCCQYPSPSGADITIEGPSARRGSRRQPGEGHRAPRRRNAGIGSPPRCPGASAATPAVRPARPATAGRLRGADTRVDPRGCRAGPRRVDLPHRPPGGQVRGVRRLCTATWASISGPGPRRSPPKCLVRVHAGFRPVHQASARHLQGGRRAGVHHRAGGGGSRP